MAGSVSGKRVTYTSDGDMPRRTPGIGSKHLSLCNLMSSLPSNQHPHIAHSNSCASRTWATSSSAEYPTNPQSFTCSHGSALQRGWRLSTARCWPRSPRKPQTLQTTGSTERRLATMGSAAAVAWIGVRSSGHEAPAAVASSAPRRLCCCWLWWWRCQLSTHSPQKVWLQGSRRLGSVSTSWQCRTAAARGRSPSLEAAAVRC
ncbi:hypothetical protein DFJ73DRAFT_847918, partial [Zopfochytrium polystomum]